MATGRSTRTRSTTRRTPARTGAVASERSVAFARKLLAERVVAPEHADYLTPLLDAHDRVTGVSVDPAVPGDQTVDQMTVSSYIDVLKSQPYLDTSATPSARVDSEGLYERDGALYLVQRSKSHRLYAKVLVDPNGHSTMADWHDATTARYVYAPGEIKNLRPTDRITPERAEQLSKWLTFCARCGIHLTADESVAAGMGPRCRSLV